MSIFYEKLYFNFLVYQEFLHSYLVDFFLHIYLEVILVYELKFSTCHAEIFLKQSSNPSIHKSGTEPKFVDNWIEL